MPGEMLVVMPGVMMPEALNNFPHEKFKLFLLVFSFYLLDEEMVEKEERLPMGPLDGGLSSIFPLGRVLIILLLSKNWFLKAK